MNQKFITFMPGISQTVIMMKLNKRHVEAIANAKVNANERFHEYRKQVLINKMHLSWLVNFIKQIKD